MEAYPPPLCDGRQVILEQGAEVRYYKQIALDAQPIVREAVVPRIHELAPQRRQRQRQQQSVHPVIHPPPSVPLSPPARARRLCCCRHQYLIFPR
jgi:hypothetical protein